MNSVASFVGIDQGKKSLVLYARDFTRNWHKRSRIRYGDWDTLEFWLGQLPKPIRVAVEASWIYYPLVDRLAAWKCDVRLANPRQLNVIFRAAKKTDRIDAKKLADALVTDTLPESYIPKPEERPDRALLTAREHLLRNRTGLVNHVREATDEIDELIEAKSEEHPQMKELVSVKGIGSVSSFALVRAVGAWDRFNKSRQVVRYTGMTPRTDISSEDQRYGRIDREGPPILRRILNEVVICAKRVNPHVAEYWKWMVEKKRKSKKRARVACARRLLVGLWAAWRQGKKFDYAICPNE